MKKDRSRNVLWRMYRLTIPFAVLFFFSVFFTICVAALQPLRAWLIQYTIDDVLPTQGQNGLLKMGIFLVILLTITSLLQYGQGILTSRVGQGIVLHLRQRVFKKIGQYHFSHLDKTPVGTLVTRAVSDMETLAEVFTEGAVSIVGDLLQIIFIMVLMFWQDWRLTLISLSVLPLLLYAGYLFKNAVKVSFTQTRNEITRLNTFVQEHLQGMALIQIFNREQKEFDKFESINRAHMDAQNKGVMAYSVFFPVVELIMALSTAFLILYGIQHMEPGGITLGMLTAFIMLINQFFRPVRMLADRFNTLQMGMVAAERIFQLLDEDHTVENGQSKKEPIIKGKIEFKHVRAGYGDGPDILKNISFMANPGMKIAIVGPTGAGKTSMAGLLSRFYPIRSGQILIDDLDIREIELTYLRNHIGMVMQDVFLFSGTLLENITLGSPEISQKQVESICMSVGIHDYIMSLPSGYHQILQERGNSLSAGQRQLIAFARTMAANPEIIVMDEATAHVDSNAEALIQKATSLLMHGRTSIVIAHRLSTIRNADLILVMEKGEIVERGNHEELYSKGGLYRTLCDQALRDM